MEYFLKMKKITLSLKLRCELLFIRKSQRESLVILSVYLETKLAGRNGHMSLIHLSVN